MDIDDLVIDLIKFFVFFLIIFKFFWLIGFKFSVVKILFILFGLFKLLIIVEKKLYNVFNNVFWNNLCVGSKLCLFFNSRFIYVLYFIRW